MKKLLAVALVLYGTFMSFVVIGGFLQKQQSESTSIKPATTKTQLKQQTPSGEFTSVQVAGHSSFSDCWLIINNNVYDVSSFLGEHPGGASTIIPYCGKEATRAFDTQDRGIGGGHSNSASVLLQGYLIGTLKPNLPK